MVLDCVLLCTCCKPEITVFDLQTRQFPDHDTNKTGQTIFWLKKQNNRLKHENKWNK